MTSEQLQKKIYSKLAAALGLVLVLAIAATFGKQTMPLTGSTMAVLAPGVVIDAGHGGYDGGAEWGDVIEKNINLSISLHLREILLAAGYRVALTRYGDYSLIEQETSNPKKREDMARRLAVIEQNAPDFFIVIHCNAMASTRWSGAQTFCQHESEQGQELAKDVQHYLREITATTRFASSLDHYLLRESNITGCLVEAGFLSNSVERELLQQDSHQRRIAAATWLGLEKYSRDKGENVEGN
ncbi:MAG TPA: N-acetylmuramoyl-L-alanine amidase CwlD [Firmicutes bacterium]|jgi:N-acetylmuramoyl-L-alanine amidase|nr:N-acetylmuramoyl-L-alanine amidase CwlD [Bacillota bacterium]HCX77904.1 N-acetylmuramoyl-L-alanine amidase CwlD [Bacillota bacterium]